VTTKACTQLLNYLDAVIHYTNSDMILKLRSNASYLSVPEARYRAGGFHYLSNNRPIIAGDPPGMAPSFPSPTMKIIREPPHAE
jgi:hypothetical protein